MISFFVDSVLGEHGPSELISIRGCIQNEPEVSADWSSPWWNFCRRESRVESRGEEHAAKYMGAGEGKPELPFGDEVAHT